MKILTKVILLILFFYTHSNLLAENKLNVICKNGDNFTPRKHCKKNEEKVNLNTLVSFITDKTSALDDQIIQGDAGTPGLKGEKGNKGKPGISTYAGLKSNQIIYGQYGLERIMHSYGPKSVCAKGSFHGAPIPEITNDDVVLVMNQELDNFCDYSQKLCEGVDCSGYVYDYSSAGYGNSVNPCCSSCCHYRVNSYCYNVHEIHEQERCLGDANNPNPAPGTLCIYPTKYFSVLYAQAITEWPFGFSVCFEHDGYPYAELEGVWAYRAP